MGQRLRMFNLAAHADNRRLAVTFQLVAGHIEDHLCQQLANFGADIAHFGAQVFHPAAPEPRVADDRHRGHQFGGRGYRLAAFNAGGLDLQQGTADFGGHGYVSGK